MKKETHAARSGDMTIRLGGRWLHSQYDPVKEASREVDEFLAGGAPAMAVVLGGGLGYQVEELHRRCPGMKIVIFESDGEIWKLAGERHQLDADGIFPIVGRDAEKNFNLLTTAMDDVSATSYRFLSRLADVDPHHYKEAAELVGLVALMLQEGLKATVLFGFLWWENTVRNYCRLASLPDVGEWFGRLDKIPAVVFAAGPTLTDDLDLFRENSGGVRFAVDTAYDALVGSGVRVDVVFSIDAQEKTLEHFSTARPKCLAASPVVPPALFELADEAVIMSFAGPLFDWFDAALGRRIERLKSGGSVTTFAFDLARKANADPILLVGADFAFRKGRRYADRTVYAKEEQSGGNRFGSLEETSFTAAHGFSITGNSDPTDTNLLQYARWMEWEIRETKSQVSRLSDFGLLSGVPVMARSEAHRTFGGSAPQFQFPVPVPDPCRIERAKCALAKERSELAAALRGGSVGLTRLSGFFDPIIRPAAVVSRSEKLDDEAMDELMTKLRRAAVVLDEVLSEASPL